MDPEFSPNRLGQAGELAEFLDPAFLLLPPTVRYPYPVVAHGDYGLCAILVHPEVVMLDPRTGKWVGRPSAVVDPEEMTDEAISDLLVAARAPEGRVTAMVWLPKGLGGPDNEVIGNVVASVNPQVAAEAVQDLMARRLSGTEEPTNPWLGSFVSSSMGPKERLPAHMRRLIAATEYTVAATVGDEAIVCYGHELTVADLVDPQFLFPAIVIAASEDWRLATRRKTHGTGFDVRIDQDPTSLLGYRLVDIQPAIPFTALAPIAATVRRCREGNEYNLDDVVRQFVRWLRKNDMDISVVEDIDRRMATSA